MTDITLDLNQTITAAVNARIEAEVARALSGDEVIGQFVSAALQQTVQVPVLADLSADEDTDFLSDKDTWAAWAKTAVERFIAEEVESIEKAVRKALRRDLDSIASTLTQSLTSAAAKTYGVDVKLDLKMPRDSG